MELSKLQAMIAQPGTVVKVDGKAVLHVVLEVEPCALLRGELVKRVARAKGCTLAQAYRLPVVCYREWLELDESREGEPETALLLEILSEWEATMKDEKTMKNEKWGES